MIVIKEVLELSGAPRNSVSDNTHFLRTRSLFLWVKYSQLIPSGCILKQLIYQVKLYSNRTFEISSLFLSGEKRNRFRFIVLDFKI